MDPDLMNLVKAQPLHPTSKQTLICLNLDIDLDGARNVSFIVELIP